MRAFCEILLSLSAVVGLLAVGWLCFGRLLTPAGGKALRLLIPAKGDGEELEQAVRGLVWLRGSGFLDGSVVIADCGLTAAGRAAAELLCRREPAVELCSLEDLERRVDEDWRPPSP